MMEPENTGEADPQQERIGTLAKAIEILETVVMSEQPITASAVSGQLGFAKPTTHRIVSNLREFGLLSREAGQNPGLVEGERLIRLAIAVLQSSMRHGHRHAILEDLTRVTGESCCLGVMTGGRVVTVDAAESSAQLALRVQVGRPFPLHCTALGKTYLGLMRDSLRRRYLGNRLLRRYTANTLADNDALRLELERIRARGGVAIDNQEFVEGAVCLSVPVFSGDGKVIAALSLAAPEARWSVNTIESHLPRLKNAASQLAESLEASAFDSEVNRAVGDPVRRMVPG